MPVFPGPPPNPLGLKVELQLNSIWTDITAYVLQRDTLQITNMGRTDQASGIQASQLTLTLKNKDGRFTPGNTAGAYSPYIIRNTPIRVSVNTTSPAPASVNYTGYRYWGQVSSWPPTTDISQHDVYVQVIASGIWRQISQSANVNIGSAYTRWITQLTGTSVPASYWSMEDGSGSLVFTITIGTGSNGTFTGQPSFAQDGTSFPGSDALPQMNNARADGFLVSSAATPTDNVMRFALSVPAAGDSTATTATTPGGVEIASMVTSGTIARIAVVLLANQLVLSGYNSSGTRIIGPAVISTQVNGVPVLVSAELTPSGSSVAWALRIIKPGAASVLDQVTGTYGSASIAAVTSVRISAQGGLSDTTIGQLGVFYAVPSLVTAAAAADGWDGEYAVTRFQRLCTEFGITSEVIGAASVQMGPQVDDTLANQFQVIENTDSGLLYEARDQWGLGYRTLASMQNQSPAVTLNYAAGALGAPLAATYDDTFLVNQWTMTNWDGYTAQATLISGALSVKPVPAGVGLYAASSNLNAYSDAQANAVAQQRLFQGTVNDVRYPQVTVDFRRGAVAGTGIAALFASVPGLRIGDYLQITNLPAFEGASTASQLVYGWTETLNAFSWSILFNTVPEAPFATGFNPGTYTVAQVANAAVPYGSAVGSSVSGSQVGSGLAGGVPSATLSARSIGGVGVFVSPTPPYDWSFAVSGTPADTTYFTATAGQAAAIAIGDTFTNSGGLGGPFTVTTLAAASGGNTSVYFAPSATSVMSSGTVYGGKNGDTWVNTAAGNQLEQWQAGAWTAIQFGAGALSATARQLGGIITTVAATAPSGALPDDLWIDAAAGNALYQYSGSAWVLYQFGSGSIAAGSIAAAQITANTITASQIAAGAITTATLAANSVTAAKIAANTITASQIAANTITAGQIAAGTILASNIAASQVYAGFVDSTVVQASEYRATSAQGEFLAYSGSSPATGTLINAIAGSAGTDGSGNPYPEGFYGQQITLQDISAPPAFTGASVLFSDLNGRLRWVSSSGVSAIVDRSSVNVTHFTIGNNTTYTQMSAALSYLANEANQSSAFEIEIRGTGTWATTTPVNIEWALYLDGASVGGGANFTFDASGYAGGTTFAYKISWVFSFLAGGSSATLDVSAAGQLQRTGLAMVTGLSNTAAGVSSGVNCDATVNHTFMAMAAFVTAAAGSGMTTVQTRITRYD